MVHFLVILGDPKSERSLKVGSKKIAKKVYGVPGNKIFGNNPVLRKYMLPVIWWAVWQQLPLLSTLINR